MVITKDILKDKKVSTKELFHYCLKYIKPYRKSFIIAFILLLFIVAFSTALPLFMGWLTNVLTVPNPLLNVIIWIAVGYLLMSVVNQILTYFVSMITTKVGQKIIYDLRMDVFSHLESMSQNQFNDMAVGSLVTRVCNYTSSISEFFSQTVFKATKDILIVLVTFIIMFIISWKLSFIMLGVAIIVFFWSYFISKTIHKRYAKQRHNLSSLNKFLNETLSGMKIIQAFNQENKYNKKFIKKNEEYRKSTISIVIAYGIYRPVISFLYCGSVALAFYFGIAFGLTAGMIVSYYLYLSYFFNPIIELSDQLNNFTKAVTSCERLFNLLDVDPEVIDNKDAINKNDFLGKIEFKHVWFAYESDNWILKDVSFTILPHQTVAFVGATGAGKSTILGLIVRNFEIQKGQILIDDIDIKNIQIKSLRNATGQMLQDVFLFSGTLKDNITLFDDSYSDEEVMKACDYVNASDIVYKNKSGLNGKVIGSGMNYSTGERQLLSFARTVLSHPQIMILDEATANIDTETEVKIQESLEKMKSIGTMLIVAHRLSTIQHSDKIVVLSNGKIVEEGNHDELLAKKGYYYRLYKLQFDEDND